jgi:hypothetical protein
MKKAKTFKNYLVWEAEKLLVRNFLRKDEVDVRGEFAYSKEEILPVMEKLSVKGKVVEGKNGRDHLGK